MAKKTTFQDLASLLIEKSGCTKTLADQFVRQYFVVIRDYLLREGIVKVKGLGTFKLVPVPERESIDVKTGNRITIAAHQRIQFVPSTDFSKRINQSFNNFPITMLEENADVSPEEQPENEDEILEEISVEGMDSVSTEETETVEEIVNEDLDSEIEIHSVYIGNEETPVDSPIPEDKSVPQSKTESETESIEEAEKEENIESESLEENYYYDDEEETSHSWWKWVVGIVVVLFLIAGSYWAGYNRLVNLEGIIPSANSVDTLTSEKLDTSDVVKVDTVATKEPEVLDSTQIWLSHSSEFEQIEGGKYVICGVDKEHVFKVGDGLIRLAVRHYGTKDATNYVVFFNKIKNPDNIPVGAVIKFPHLEKVDQ